MKQGLTRRDLLTRGANVSTGVIAASLLLPDNSKANEFNVSTDEFVNVLDFGALGDGFTEDSVAVQYVLDQFASNNQSVTIFFPLGTYLLGNLHCNHPGHIRFLGERGSILKFSQSNPDVEKILFIEDPTWLEIYNFEIDINNNSYSTLIDISTNIDSRSDSIIIEKLYFRSGGEGTDANASAIQIRTPEKVDFGAHRILINECQFDDWGSAFALRIRGAHDFVQIANCTATDPYLRSNKVFTVTSDVSNKSFQVNQVVVSNCHTEYSGTAFFFQNCQTITCADCSVSYLYTFGNNTIYAGPGGAALKIDNVHYRPGQSATISNFKTVYSNQDASKFIASIWLAEGCRDSRVIDSSVDRELKLGGGTEGDEGHSNSVIGGRVHGPNGRITMYYGCVVLNVALIGEDGEDKPKIYLQDKGIISNCKFINHAGLMVVHAPYQEEVWVEGNIFDNSSFISFDPHDKIRARVRGNHGGELRIGRSVEDSRKITLYFENNSIRLGNGVAEKLAVANVFSFNNITLNDFGTYEFTLPNSIL